jgi:LytTr DNA-binding domain
MSIKSYLNRPHPQSENHWVVLISISLFIGVFMFIFQPFGLNYLKHEYKTFIILGYGLVTFCILFINLFLIENLFKNVFIEENWTVLRQIIWLTWIIFTIGIGNFIYSNYLFSFSWSGWKTFLLFQFFTLIIGLIPVSILTIWKQNKLLAKNLKSAIEVNEKLKSLPETKNLNANEVIELVAENRKDKITLKLSDLLYVESVGNYVEVCHMVDEDIKKSILRSSLKRLEQVIIEFPDLFKCHRAFIINVNKVIHANGNSQGYRLKMQNIDFEIPVSRNYTKSLKEKLN